MAKIIETIACETVKGLLGHLTSWSSAYPLERYVFRGHSDAAFTLLPSALRPDNRWKLWFVGHMAMPNPSDAATELWQHSIEWQALQRFYRLADRNGLLLPVVKSYRSNLNVELYSSFRSQPSTHWLPDELLELAGLAQHYGVPTRLLDWTYDPMTACYFAAHGQTSKSGLLDVWALNHEWLSFIGGTVEATRVKFVTPPYFGNPNLAAQRGLFSMWSEEVVLLERGGPPPASPINVDPLDMRLQQHFDSNGREQEEPLLLRFSLPESERDHLKDVLLKMDYGKGRLFPGYGGVVGQMFETGWTLEPL